MDSVWRRRRHFLFVNTFSSLVQRAWAIGLPESHLRVTALSAGEEPSKELVTLHRSANVLGVGLDWFNLTTLAQLSLDGDGHTYNIIERVAFRANIVALIGLWLNSGAGLLFGLPSGFDPTKALYGFVWRTFMCVYAAIAAATEGF